MVKGWWYVATACLMVGMAASPAQADESKKPTSTLTVHTDSAESQADVKEVVDAVLQINAGKIQQAIDGPLTDVVNRYEKRYANSPDAVVSARGQVQALLYLTLAAEVNAKKGGSRNAIDVGPAWAMAYWARGYGYSEMNRFPEAEIELKKAIALAPSDAQYNSELAYVYQMQKRYEESLALYKAMPEMLGALDDLPESAKTEFRCKSFRGQGFDLVELKRYDEAEAAYKACLALVPGEPKSLGELEYIKGVRAKGG
jgi:tetratricopeptide (TPR) repeat protein